MGNESVVLLWVHHPDHLYIIGYVVSYVYVWLNPNPSNGPAYQSQQSHVLVVNITHTPDGEG